MTSKKQMRRHRRRTRYKMTRMDIYVSDNFLSAGEHRNNAEESLMPPPAEEQNLPFANGNRTNPDANKTLGSHLAWNAAITNCTTLPLRAPLMLAQTTQPQRQNPYVQICDHECGDFDPGNCLSHGKKDWTTGTMQEEPCKTNTCWYRY